MRASETLCTAAGLGAAAWRRSPLQNARGSALQRPARPVEPSRAFSDPRELRVRRVSTTHRGVRGTDLPFAIWRVQHETQAEDDALCRNSNLGELQRFAGVDESSVVASSWLAVPPSTFRPSEPYIDAPAILGSFVLLSVILAAGFSRLVGTDRLLDALERAWERRKGRTRSRRLEKLERDFDR